MSNAKALGENEKSLPPPACRMFRESIEFTALLNLKSSIPLFLVIKSLNGARGLMNYKLLSSLLPVGSFCRKIR